MTVDEKLERFSERSNSDAESEVQAELDKYQAQLDRLFEDHKKQKDREAKDAVDNEKTALEHQYNKEQSTKLIDIRHSVAEKQGEIKKEIFDEVEKKLLDYKKDPKYVHWVCRKVMISKKVAGSDEMEVYIDSSDESFKEEIEETTGTTVHISKDNILGGVRAVIPARKILIDDSFASLIADAKENFSFEGGAQA